MVGEFAAKALEQHFMVIALLGIQIAGEELSVDAAECFDPVQVIGYGRALAADQEVATLPDEQVTVTGSSGFASFF